MVEGRLTCDLKEGGKIPPAEVPFIPLGDANAYLEGTLGKTRLDFVSPIRFRRQEDNNIVVINRFSLSASSDLGGRPINSLANFNILTIPSLAIGSEKSLGMMKLYEISMSLNGKDVWYYSYPVNQPFQPQAVFRIPLEDLSKTLDKSYN